MAEFLPVLACRPRVSWCATRPQPWTATRAAKRSSARWPRCAYTRVVTTLLILLCIVCCYGGKAFTAEAVSPAGIQPGTPGGVRCNLPTGALVCYLHLQRYATDACFDVANSALQLLGGYGYLREYGIERYMRDLRVVRCSKWEWHRGPVGGGGCWNERGMRWAAFTAETHEGLPPLIRPAPSSFQKQSCNFS